MTDTIAPSVLAAAFEILRAAASDPASVNSRLEQLGEASCAAQRSIDAANRTRGELAAEQAVHEKRLAALSAEQKREHEARTKELSVREGRLATAQRDLESERDRVVRLERAVENRAADLSNRMGHRGLGAEA